MALACSMCMRLTETEFGHQTTFNENIADNEQNTANQKESVCLAGIISVLGASICYEKAREPYSTENHDQQTLYKDELDI